MKKYFGIFLLFLFGCASSLTHTSMPLEPISTKTASITNGALKKKNLFFTMISQYQKEDQVRAVVLMEPAIKLIDLTVTEDEIQVHFKADKVPNRLVKAFGQLIRDKFMTSCPSKKIVYYSTQLREEFELEVTGGVCL